MDISVDRVQRNIILLSTYSVVFWTNVILLVIAGVIRRYPIILSGECNTFDDLASMDGIYRCPVFNYVAKAWRQNITVTSQWARWRLNLPPHHFLLNPLYWRRSKKTSKLRVTGLCAGGIQRWLVNSPHKWLATGIMAWHLRPLWGLHSCPQISLRIPPKKLAMTAGSILTLLNRAMYFFTNIPAISVS